MCLLFFLAGCQDKREVHTIGVVIGDPYLGALGESFRDYMHVLGYKEHEHVRYVMHIGDYDKQQVAEIAEGFIENHVDLIITAPTGVTSTVQAIARKSATPVIFGIAHTEGTGIVNSVKRPEKNSTGVRFPTEQLAIQRFDYLLSLVPDAKTILIPHRSGYPGVEAYMSVLEERAEKEDKTLVPVGLSSRQDFDRFIEDYSSTGLAPVDAILQLPDPVGRSLDYFEMYGRFAMNKDIVVGGDYLEADDMTSTFGVQVDVQSAAWQAAFLAWKVLEGAKAGQLAVRDPEAELTINLKELQRLGIDTPYDLLDKADVVIK